MKKLISKYKYYLILALIVIVLGVALFFNIKDEDFYKDILEWRLETDKSRKKELMDQYRETGEKTEEEIDKIEKEIEKIDKIKEKKKKEVEEKDFQEVGKMFQDMGY